MSRLPSPVSASRETRRSVPAYHCILFAATLLASTVTASAQFNGPPSSGTAEMNRPVAVTTDPSVLFPSEQDVVISTGDLLSFKLFGDADYSPTVRVAADGTVLLPLIGVVHLSGLTVTQSELLVEERLSSAGMYNNPQITIQIAEGPNEVATLAGEIHSVVPIVGSRRLLDVLAAGGGLPPTASHVLTIDRPGVKDPIVIDLGSDPLRSGLANVPIFPGDTIIVSRIGIVYILGAFKGTTGTIPLNAYTPLTLTEATALSGGVLFEGKFSDLRIIRTTGDKRTVATFNIKDVLNGKVPDPILQPNDIVYLPSSNFKALLSSGALGTVLGIASLAISITDR